MTRALPSGRITSTVAAAGLVALTIPMPACGQAAIDDSSGPATIDGYGPVSWGADSTAVVAAEGAPHNVRMVEGFSARALIYAQRTLGRTRGSLGYLIHPTRGLLRVQYLSEYGSGERCLDMYQNLRDTLTQRYSGIPRREHMYNQSDDLSFCTAFQLGQAGARTIWRDPRTGARAWVALDLEAGVVRVSVESPEFEPTEPRGKSPGAG